MRQEMRDGGWELRYKRQERPEGGREKENAERNGGKGVGMDKSEREEIGGRRGGRETREGEGGGRGGGTTARRPGAAVAASPSV